MPLVGSPRENRFQVTGQRAVQKPLVIDDQKQRLVLILGTIMGLSSPRPPRPRPAEGAIKDRCNLIQVKLIQCDAQSQ